MLLKGLLKGSNNTNDIAHIIWVLAKFCLRLVMRLDLVLWILVF
jgi:hypothetical protein